MAHQPTIATDEPRPEDRRVTDFTLDRRDALKTTGVGLLSGVTVPTARGVEFGSDHLNVYAPNGNVLHALDETTGEEQWSFEADSIIDQGPVVVGGTVYFGCRDDNAYAVDAATGDERWTSQVATNGQVQVSPTVVNDTVYIPSTTGDLSALDAASGTRQWVHTTESNEWATTPHVVDESVYVGTDQGNVYAVDANTGERRWRFSDIEGLLGYGASSPTARQGTVYFSDTDAYLYAVDAATGELQWRTDGANGSSAPVVAGATVYHCGGKLIAVDAAAGEQQWSFEVSGALTGLPPALSEGRLYVLNDGSTGVYSVDAATGERRWSSEVNTFGGIPTVANDTLYVGSSSSESTLYALDAETGDQLWSFVSDNGSDYGGATVAGASGGRSIDSRVTLGVGGHHDVWAGTVFDITASADAVAPGEPVRFALEGTDGEDVSVEWSFGDGSTATGKRVRHIYEADGDYTVSATTTGSVETTTRTSVSVVEGPFLTVDPLNPTVADTVRFRGVGTGAEGYRWELGDGTTAAGAETTHSYEEPGEYTVTLTDPERNESAQTTIEVAEVPIDITDVSLAPEAAITGAGLDLPIDVTAAIETNADRSVDSVTVTVGGTTVDASPVDGSGDPPRYRATVQQSALDLEPGLTAVTVTAIADDGTTPKYSVQLPVYGIGPGLDLFVDDPTYDPDDGVLEFGQTYFDFDVEITTGADRVPDNVPWVDATLVRLAAVAESAGTFDLDTGAAALEGEGAVGANVVGVGAELQSGIGTTGRLDSETFLADLRLDEWWYATLLSPRSGKKLTFKVPSWVPKIKKITLTLQARVGGLFEYDEFARVDGSPPVLATDGINDVYVPLTLNTSGEIAGVGVEPFIDGYLHVAGDVAVSNPAPPLVGLSTPEGGKASLDGGVTLSYGPLEEELSISRLAELTDEFSQPELTVGTTREPPDWEAYDIDVPGQQGAQFPGTTVPDAPPGARQNGPSLRDPTGPSPGADAVEGGTDASSLARLTDRDRIDTGPAIAQRGDTQLAVWEGHRQGAPDADGRDIATASRPADGEWSTDGFLTATEGTSLHRPALAAAGGRAALVYERIDTGVVDDVESFADYVDVAVRIDDGSGWSDAVALPTDAARVQRAPAVASLSDTQWIVAWEQVADDGSTAVRYAVVEDDGTIGREETIGGAADPDLAASTDGVVLASYDPGTETVMRDLLTAATRQRQDEYDASTVEGLSVSAGGTAWLAGASTAGESTVRFASAGGTAGDVPVPVDRQPVRSIRLLETERGPALVYRSSEEREGTAISYQVRRTDAWLPPRAVVRAASETVTLTRPAVAPATDSAGISVAAAVTPRASGGVGDLVVGTQPFEPTYAISGDPETTDVFPGDQVTISYTLENVGERSGTETIEIEARSQDATFASAEADPLDPGQTVSGELTMVLDATGTMKLVAGPGLSDGVPPDGTDEVVVSTPGLVVPADGTGVTVERTGDATATATVAVRNDGPIRASDVDVRLESGGTALGTGTVAQIVAGDTQTVEVEFDPRAIDVEATEVARLDPTRRLPSTYLDRRSTPVVVGQPDVRIAESVEYLEQPFAIDATVLVTNGGPLPAAGRLLAVRADATGGFPDESVLGATSVRLPPAIETDTVARPVTVPMSGVAAGDDVRFVYAPARRRSTAGIPVVDDTIEPVLAGDDLLVVAQYANDAGIVDTAGLTTALDDWQRGDIGTELLRGVVRYWATGDEVT